MAITPLPPQGSESWYGWAADIDAAARAAGTDASQLTSGTLPAARVADGSITAAKVAADVATTAAVTTASTADRNRANHSGTQSADTLTDGTTNKAFLATERTKLAGVATAATANSTDAQLRDRSTHTGTQAVSTITGLAPVATSGSYADLTGKPTIPDTAAYMRTADAGTAGTTTGDALRAALTPPVIPVGADPTGSVDSTLAIQAAITSALASNSEVYIPAGTYKCTAAITASAGTVRIRGAGAGTTVLSFTGSTYDLLTIGNGAGNQVRSTGYLRGLTVRGPSDAPSSGHAAVVVNGLTQFEVSNVQADRQDIGFDLINNCYGSQFNNIRAGFGGSVNVGVNLRTGGQSGSDISFFNPWIGGRIAGFSCSGGGGGYHIFGGQVTGGIGTNAINDNAGAIVLGKDYLTSVTGETSVDLHGVSFEGTMYAWIVRAFDQSVITMHGAYANPAQSATPAIGFYKHESHKNSRMTLSGTTISGFWSAASLVSIAGSYGGTFIFETGTYPAANQPTVAGTPTYVSSIAAQAGLSGNAIIAASTGLTVSGAAPVTTTRTITAGTGLTGGGDLSANRTLAVSFGTTTGTAAQGDDSRFTTVAANTQTGTGYTLVLADAGRVIEMNNAAANTLTIPPNSSVAFPVGTVIEVHQYGAGTTTVTGGAGVTLRAPDGARTSKQYASASLRKRGTDEWVLAGSTIV